MKCPLLTMVAYPITEPISHTDRDCLEEKCSWWHKGLEDCRLTVIDDSLATIMGTLLSLSLDLEKSGKLPHWKPTSKQEELKQR